MRKSLNRLEELVFEEPFIQTSKYNLLELHSHNRGNSHFLDNILMPNTARLVAKTIAVRKGVWVVRMEQTLEKLQEELSDEWIVRDLDATHPTDNMWAWDIMLLGVICIISYAIYLLCFN
jgi:hypothetical protein